MAIENGTPHMLDLENLIGNPFWRICYRVVRAPVESFLWKENILKIYGETSAGKVDICFIDAVLSRLGITVRVTEEELHRIPPTGPLIVVSNHPFGGLDGMILLHLLASVRPNVKIMANYLLSMIPQVKGRFIAVDPYGGSESVARNIKPVREAIQNLKDNGMLCTFPAGEVAHFQWKKMAIEDPPWNPMVAYLVRKTQAAVLPVCFRGSNSALFHLLGVLHPRIRTVMLPSEILKKANATIHVAIGKPIGYKALKRFPTDGEMMAYLRLKNFLLKKRLLQEEKKNGKESKNKKAPGSPLASAVDVKKLVEEIEQLPEESLILANHQYRIYLNDSYPMPYVMQEIGRLRELTFRSVGEGTGKKLDIDGFDTHYRHLFLWDAAEKKIVGAYRLGFSDVILSTHGLKGFYTRSLFDYHSSFLQRIHPAIELGRSFVRPEYQRSYQPLMLLWKGIGQVVMRNPDYKMLFGPVSITDKYEAVSRQLIVAFMKRNAFDTELSRKIRPRVHPREPVFRGKSIKRAVSYLEDVQALSDLISEIEHKQIGIPILLKQYMKLGGKILGFSLDPKFSNVLDALILVDLTQTERKILNRYMGEAGAEAFRRHHEGNGLKKCA